MEKKRFSAEQIVTLVRQIEVLISVKNIHHGRPLQRGQISFATSELAIRMKSRLGREFRECILRQKHTALRLQCAHIDAGLHLAAML